MRNAVLAPMALAAAAACALVHVVHCSNPLVPNVGMSDPHVHIFSGRAVMYASHDAGGVNSTFWDMPDWHVWTWAPEFGGRNGFPPPEKKALVLSVKMGCADTVPV